MHRAHLNQASRTGMMSTSLGAWGCISGNWRPELLLGLPDRSATQAPEKPQVSCNYRKCCILNKGTCVCVSRVELPPTCRTVHIQVQRWQSTPSPDATDNGPPGPGPGRQWRGGRRGRVCDFLENRVMTDGWLHTATNEAGDMKGATMLARPLSCARAWVSFVGGIGWDLGMQHARDRGSQS